jgi:hypothetical protein
MAMIARTTPMTSAERRWRRTTSAIDVKARGFISASLDCTLIRRHEHYDHAPRHLPTEIFA